MLLLRPFLLDNLLRVGGRIGQSFLPFYSKHQIILPKSHSHQHCWYKMPILETATQE